MVSAKSGRKGAGERKSSSTFGSEHLSAALRLLLQVGDYGPELGLFFRPQPDKRDPKGFALDPSNDPFVNAEGPIQTGNVEPTFKGLSLCHARLTLDPAPALRKIESSSLAFLAHTGKGAAELGRKTRLNPAFIRRVLEWLLS
jgi:hypothetical protein